MKRFLATYSILFLTSFLLVQGDLLGQSLTGDPLIDINDNPTGRAEFELMKRADPATGRIPVGIRSRELEFASTIPSREMLFEERLKGGAATLAAPVQWRERGPNNQGGRTRALGIDVSNEGVILAGGVSGGMWRSEDAGDSWTKVTAIGEIHSVTCLAQDTRPGSQHIWYYGTGEQRANSANLPGDGIFKSTDGGRSWTRLESTIKNSPQSRDQMFDYVHRIVIDPSNLNQDEVYAACYGGIARSTDGGESWEPVLGDLANAASYSNVDITSDGVLYATLSKNGRNVEGIWRSTDGINWTDITPPNFPSSYNKISVGIAPSNENKIYFLGQTPGSGKNGHSLWMYEHSSNGQSTWEDRSDGLRSNTQSYSSYCLVVRVKPTDEDVVFIGHVQLQRSTNGFRDSANTRTIMGSGQHADQHEIIFFPSNANAMLTGHDGGVSLTENNVTNTIRWQSLNNGYATTQFYSIAIDHAVAGNETMIGGTQDNGTWFLNSDQDNVDGRKIFGADGGYCAIADSGTSYYTSYQNGQIFRSEVREDGSRQRYTRIDPEGGDSYFFIHPFTLDPSDTRIMYLPEGRDFWRNDDLTEIPLDNRSTKKELNWNRLANARIRSGIGNISAVGVSRNNPTHRVYYGTNQGRLFRLEEAHIGDPTPVEVTDQRMEGGFINCIAVDPHNGDHVLLAISNYNRHSLFYSEDAGESWELVGGNLEEQANGRGNGPSVSWCTILPVGGFRYYLAGTTTGLYSTTLLSGMDTRWVQEGASTIGNVVIDMIDARESDGFVAVGTHGRGMYSANVGQALIQANLRFSEGSINFGEVPIGKSTVDTLVISNDPSSARDIQGTLRDPESPFAILSSNEPFSLAPGQEQEVVIEFTPDAIELFSVPFSIVHDATDPSPPTSIWLIGKGVEGNLNSVDDPVAISQLIQRFESLPNRFSKQTKLYLTLSESEVVSLTAYDNDGKVVDEILNQKLEAGEHQLLWEPSHLSSGIYYLQLKTQLGIKTISVYVER